MISAFLRFSATHGGDGGRKSPEHLAQSAHVVCGSLPIAEQSRFIEYILARTNQRQKAYRRLAS
jgi:hypothetical protein